ncbi:MAG: hypothetical protein CSA39_04020 [Flavobacteriales bacterium]|nr:MAG: hypothetical protein CSA39_04020 [Flavobacteriales bacterium]
MKNKKIWVLIALFIIPLVFYLFILTGKNEFARLPVLTKKVGDITAFESKQNNLSLDGKISILFFLGDDLDVAKSNAFNLNEKIYKHFYKFRDFQFIVVLPKGTEQQAVALEKELAFATDMGKWHFIYGNREQINNLFMSLKTNLSIKENGYAPYAFIIDKDRNLRGRTDDEDMANQILYGYNSESVAPIHNKMVDDVKVLVAEYRLALKKYKRDI